MRRALFSSLLVACGSLLPLACGEADPPAPVLSPEERLARPADLATGRQLFRRCATCHEAAEGTGHRVGPNLWGVVGEPAGRHPDFAYSAALERSGLVWDEEALDAYLTDPQAVIPGGRMAYPGDPNAANRRDLIAHLRALSDPPAE